MPDTNFDMNRVRINNIIVTNAQINNERNIVALEKGKHIFKLSYKFDLAVNIEESKLRLIFKCDLTAFEKDGVTKLPVNGTFEICFFFSITDLKDVLGNKLVINKDLGLSLTNIAYSTARGIIYTRCQGTILHKWILPILTDTEIINLQKEPNQTPIIKD